MTAAVNGTYGGYNYQSPEARALGSITQESYDYRDQAKLITKLTGDVSYMAGYMRKMQKGIDDANQNVVQQLQSLINDLLVLLGGSGDTGFEFGDLKYVLQGIGALFGFDSGLSLPINLSEAAWHFFSEYILGISNFQNVMDQLFDTAIATIINIFGDVPIVGQAVQQLAVILTNLRDGAGELAQKITDVINNIIDAFGGAINTGLTGLYNACKNIPGLNIVSTILANIIPGLDASKITTGQFDQSRITNLQGSLAAKLETSTYNFRAKAGANLVISPNFEQISILRNGYKAGTWTTSGYTAVQKHTGFRSWTWTHPSGGAADGVRLTPTELDTAFDVVPGDKYYVELYYYAGSTNGTAGNLLILGEFDGGVAASTVATVSNATLTKGQWNKLSGYLSIPAGVTQLYVSVVSDATTSVGNVYYVDSIVIKEATESTGIKQGLFGSNGVLANILSGVVPSLDASKVTTGTFGSGLIPTLAQSKITNLTTDLSNKIETAVYNAKVKAGANLIPAPSFEITTVKRCDYATSAWITTGYTTAQKRSGLRSWTWTAGNAAWSGIRLTGTESDTSFDVTPGEKYYAEVYYYAPSTNNMSVGNLSLGCHFYIGGVYTSGANFASVTNISATTNQWNKLSGYVTIPANIDSMNVWFLSDNLTTSGNVYYVDDAVVKEATESTGIKQGLFGSNSVLSNLLSGVIPSLDASKVTTGSFGTALIPPLDTSKITTGSFGSGFITDGAVSNAKLGTDISGDKIVAGTVTAARVGVLDASKVTTGSFLTSLIPTLDASKIGTGSFLSSLIPSLDASKVTTGSFLSNLIPNLDAAKVTTGSFLTSLIPALDASKVTTGNFAQSRVTNLTTDLGNTDIMARGALQRGANLVTNVGFESPLYYAGGAAWSTEQAYSGTQSLKITGTATTQWLNPFFSTTSSALRLPCKSNDTYYVEFQIFPHASNGAGAANGIMFYFRVEDKTYTQIGTPSYMIDTTTLTKGAWNTISAYISFGAIAGATWMIPNLAVYAAENGNVYYIDNPIIHRVTETADTNKTLFNSNTPLANILSAIIPSLDASKIGSGALADARIPSLAASKITSGTFGSGFIADGAIGNLKLGTDIDGAKIAVGTVGAARIPTLDGSKIGSGTIAASFIASLDAAKIATGTFLSNLIPGLDTSKITTGTFGSGFLADGAVSNTKLGTDIDGSKIAVGSVAAARIAALDASKISTGTFGTGLIPALDAAKITTGSFLTSLIPTLDAAKIGTGSFLTSLIPALDASKVTTGNFAQSRVTNLTTDLGTAQTTANVARSTVLTYVKSGNNMILSGSFEDANILYNENQGHTRSTDVARTGSYSLKSDVTALWKYSVVNRGPDGSLPMNVSPGDVLYTEAWVYGKTTNVQTSGGANRLRILVQFYDGANTYMSGQDVNTILYTASTALNGVWTKLSGYATVPAGAGYAHMIIATDGSGITLGDIYYWDDCACYRTTEAVTTNKSLFNSNTPLANLLTSIIPSLDASKVTTGTLGTGLIPSLDAAKITTGSFLSSLIPSLDAAKIGTGTFLSTLIPALDGSKITTGTLGAARIPALPQSQITGLTNMFRGRDNIVTNPGFESTSFYLGGSPNVSYSTDFARSGTYSAKVTYNASNRWISLCTTDTANLPIAVTQNDVIYMEAWVRGADTNVGTTGGLYLYAQSRSGPDLSGATLDNLQAVGIACNPSLSGGWTKISGYVAIANASAVSVYLGIYCTTSVWNANDIYYVDDPVVRIVTGTNQLTKALYNANTTASTVLTSVVPSLDASKISTGTLGTSIIPSLDAGKITTGSFLSSLIPTLDAAKIGTGSFLSSLIPALDASKISTGNFAQNRVTNLSSDLGILGTFAKDSTNLVAGSDFDSANQPWNVGSVPLAYFDYDTTVYRSGTKSLKIMPGAVANYTITYCGTGNTSAYFETKAGEQFYIEMWVRRSADYATDGSGPRFRFSRGNGPVAGNTWGNFVITAAMIPSADTWTKITGTFTMPDEAGVNSTVFNITGFPATPTGAGTLWIDDIVVRRVAHSGLIGDGIISNLKLGTDIDGSKIAVGTVGAARIPTLDGSKIGSGTIAASFIASLDAAKIATGTFLSNLIPGLDTSKITSGTFGSAFHADGSITNAKLGTDISGDKIVAGTVTAARVGALDASKVSTGTFGSGLIPSLDAGKITTGSFLTSLIPSLDASKITTGTLAQSFITNLISDFTTTKNLARGKLSSGTNLVSNPGFEYTTFAENSLLDATIKRTGSRSLKQVADGASYKTQHLFLDESAALMVPAIGGDVFYVEGYVLCSGGTTPTTGTLWIQSQAYDKAGTVLGYPSTTSVPATAVSTDANNWTKISGYLEMPANTARFQIYTVVGNTVTSGATFYWDDIVVKEYSHTAGLNKTLFNNNTPLSALLGTIIPGLDAAKITTGTFSNAMIGSGLDAAKLTTGTLPIARIGAGAVTNAYLGTDIDGSKIGAGSVAAARIAALDAAKITTGTFGTAMIADAAITGVKTAGLDGSKITTGTIAESIIATLSASKIGSGILDILRVPDLSTSKITSGTFGTAFIADAAITGVKTAALDASKITTGAMAQAQVTNLGTDLGNRVENSTYNAFLSGGASNLATNPSFEDTSQYLWSATANTNAAYVRSGTRSLALTANGTYKYIGVCTSKTGEIYIQGGPSTKYYFEFYVKGDATNTTTGSAIAVNFGIWTADVAKVSTGTVYWTGLTYDQIGTAGWVKASGYITVPATSTIAFHRPIIHLPSTATAGTFYFDDVLFEDVTEIVNTNVALFNNNTPLSAILGTIIPSLDAAKIGSGQFSNAMIASGLDAAKLTTGTLPIARIGAGTVTNTYLGTDIDGSKIGAGSVAAARIAALDAGKIATGTFGSAFITDGAITSTKIGSLAVGTGHIADSAVTGVKTTGLDASKINTGSLAQSLVTNLTTDLGAKLPSSSYIDQISNALIGESVTSGNAIGDALSALQRTFNTLQDHSRKIKDLEISKTAQSVKGMSVNINFNDYADNYTTLPTTQFSTATYTGSATPKLGIVGGLACWATTANADCDGKVIHLTPTNTDFQLLRGTMNTPPQKNNGGGTNPKFAAIGRVSADGNSYIFARAYCDGFLSFKGEIGYVLNGVETVWASNISLTWNLDMTLKIGNGTNKRQHQVWSGNTLVKEWDETYTNGVSGTVNESRSLLQGDWLVSKGAATGGTFTLTYDGSTTVAIAYNATAATVKTALTNLGKGTFFVNATTNGWYINPPDSTKTMTGTGTLLTPSNTLTVTQQTAVRRWGSIAQIRSGTGGPYHSGKLGGASAADNETPAVNGTVARMYRASTGNVTFTGGSAVTAIPSSFFDNVEFESPDLDAQTSTSAITVTESAPYHISARIMTGNVAAWGHLILQVYRGATWVDEQWGNPIYMNDGEAALVGNWIQYLYAGEAVRLAYVRGGITTTSLTGESTGKKTYFSIAKVG